MGVDAFARGMVRGTSGSIDPICVLDCGGLECCPLQSAGHARSQQEDMLLPYQTRVPKIVVLGAPSVAVVYMGLRFYCESNMDLGSV